MVLNAVSGIAGLRPTVAALEAKKNLALANKESIIAAGEIILQLAKKKKVMVLPVDSEHSAIFQCLECAKKQEHVKKILLTASGGPFFGKNREDLKNVTVEDALCHPSWKNMGKKITIDSASLLNKGLELIEACKLFNIAPENIEVVIHRESIIHSMIQLKDSSVIAQAATADMGLPIQYALTYPKRCESDTKSLDFAQIKSLTFASPDEETFKLLPICRKVAQIGGTAPAFIVAVSEFVTERFIEKKISFLEMMDFIEKAFTSYKFKELLKIEDVFEARNEAIKLLFEFSNI
jgi:1-deoxy-D-xylulose-5-phosphate reductoisomerase